MTYFSSISLQHEYQVVPNGTNTAMASNSCGASVRYFVASHKDIIFTQPCP